MKSREISRSKIGPFSLACTDPYISIGWENQPILNGRTLGIKCAASWQNQQNGMCAHRRQISLGIRPVWSVFALRMKKDWVLIYPLSASEDSDQTGWMPRLIWVFAGRTCHFVGFVMRRIKCAFISMLLLSESISSNFLLSVTDLEVISVLSFQIK